MFNIKTLISIILTILLFSSISLADTFVVRNLNDPGPGSLRRAITNSNINPGPDTIEFRKGLQGTIFLNAGNLAIQDDLTINGPGGGGITIDARGISNIFDIFDDDNEKNNIVIIRDLRLINGVAGNGSLIDNNENLTVESCQFINGTASISGGAINNTKFLTVDSCLFENNSAEFGGAIFNNLGGIILSIDYSEFKFNKANEGGAISNKDTLQLIQNSTFEYNNANGGGAISNSLIINEIIHSTFNKNIASGSGGAITNSSRAILEKILNCSFNENVALSPPYLGSAIYNGGIINISFSTIARSKIELENSNNLYLETIPNLKFSPAGAAIFSFHGTTSILNSIIAFNSPNNCVGNIFDYGGNYSDTRCGTLGNFSEIILGPLADNGGPTKTMDLAGGDPVNGATVNCDALDENGNPTGIPIGVDQRYFPRPFGIGCNSGAFEDSPSATVTISKVTDPAGGSDFRFTSSGFNPLQECPLDGGGDKMFALSDGESISCNVPEGNYYIKEIIPQGYRLAIICLEAPDDIVINDETGEIDFTIVSSESVVDCIYTNIKKGSGGGSCALASGSNNNSFPLYLLILYLLIPAIILMRRFIRKYRHRAFKDL